MITIGQIKDIERILQIDRIYIGVDSRTLGPILYSPRTPKYSKRFNMIDLIDKNNSIEEGANYLKNIYNS